MWFQSRYILLRLSMTMNLFICDECFGMFNCEEECVYFRSQDIWVLKQFFSYVYMHWFIVDSGSHDVAMPFSIWGGGGGERAIRVV